MKTLSPNVRPELRPMVRNLGRIPEAAATATATATAAAGLSHRQVDEVANYVLCNITTYLLSLEARDTLRAEGKDGVLPRASQQWSPGETDVTDSRDPAWSLCTVGSFMPGSHTWVLNTCFDRGGVRLE